MADNTNNMNGSMCKSNCGFFGNAACDGYCSKCYKDHVKRQNSGSAAGRVTPTTGISSITQSASTSIAAAVTAAIANQSISQMNSISEIPSSSFKQPTVNSEPAISETAKADAGKMLPPLSPPPVTFSLESAEDSVPPLPQLTTSTSSINNSSAPIAIPGRLGAPASHTNAMSVPNDLCASMASTCDGDVASSIEMNNSLNANTLSTSNSSGDMAGKTKKRTRCVMDDCKRKVGLTGFDCRCGGLYCWEHRYSDKHNCLFDYKELGQDQIRKANPIVVGEKIAKI